MKIYICVVTHPEVNIVSVGVARTQAEAKLKAWRNLTHETAPIDEMSEEWFEDQLSTE